MVIPIVGAGTPDMRFEKVVILTKCLAVFKTESLKALGTETGGPLVGHIAQARILLVTDACGPGPRAKLERCSVTIDGAFAQKFCDRAFNESKGTTDYVGDWHKHTGLSLKPSKDDVAAMKLMADFQWSPTTHPISLIYRMWPRAFRVYVWDGSGSLEKMASSINPEDSYA